VAVPDAAWRCFPWDARAEPGAPFSPSHLVRGQTVGRFDRHDRPPVRYLAESPEHAIGEALGPFRGTTFHPAYLRQSGHALALVEITLAPSLRARILDCTEPKVMDAWSLRPDELAHHERSRTQAIARRLYETGNASGMPAGVRWWSALTGAWHATIVFTDREQPGEIAFATPQVVRADDPVVTRALSILGIRVR